ncbi:MAG TPA: CHAT domain-containing protein [Thermoanaerobaculia bacterium]|nr:CHAT domain-containing protein [Thermoanaerobaculia bacterium]
MSQMKDSYLLLRLLKANRQQLEKLLGRDWPAFLNLLESTLDSFLHGVPRSGYTRNIRDIIDWVTRDAGERAADILRDVVKSVPVTQALPPGEIEVALPDSPTVVLTVPEGIPAGKVARYQVEEEAEVMMREIVGKQAAPPERPRWEVHYEVPDPEPAPDPGAAYVGWAGTVEYRGPSDPKRGPAAPGLSVRDEERPRPASTPPATRPDEFRINVWIAERTVNKSLPLDLGEAYSLLFQYSQPLSQSLVSGPQTLIPLEDIPETGLDTEWIVVSSDLEISASEPGIEVKAMPAPAVWSARFSLRIPRRGASEQRALTIRPRSGPAKVSILIYALSPKGRRELYRELDLTLAVQGESQPGTPVLEKQEEQVAAARHLGLRTTHEWTTPRGHLSIIVPKAGSTVFVDASYDAQDIDNEEILTPWDVKKLAGRINNVRASAEKFRSKWESYLNDIDPASLPAGLQGYRFSADANWGQLRNLADSVHQAAWDQVKVSPELRDMAVDGHALYQALFPKDTDLRGWVDALPPGSRLEISWKDGEVSNIPWSLLYRKPAPPTGAEVEATDFLGLCYRIAYSTHKTSDRSKALGSPAAVHQASFLYWGDHPADITGTEARWQRNLWAGLPNQEIVPSATSADRRRELLRLWNDPDPSPAVLYFFCQCKVGDGNDPVLSFGDSAADILRRTELAGDDLGDRPFVFANACTTASADPYIANELEATFFERGCRGFLGTETKVPIPMAARFASIFFEFFYRRVDPEPMAAGEALAQSRIFLWTRYRNIGGLFYTYINQYELFLADDAEVAALRA